MNKPVVIAAACFTAAIGVVSFIGGMNYGRESASLSAAESPAIVNQVAEISSENTTTTAKTTTALTTRATTSSTAATTTTAFDENSVADVASAIAEFEAEKIVVTQETTTAATTTTAASTTVSTTKATAASTTAAPKSSTTTPPVSTTAATTTTYKKPSVFTSEKDVYAAISYAIANGDSSVSFTASGSLKLPDLNAIMKKNPQISSIGYSKVGSSVTYNLGLSTGAKVLAAYRSGNINKLSASEKKLYDKCKEILSKYTKPTNTLEENMKAIHDYIVLNTAYDYDNFVKKSIPARSQTAEGALLYGKAVCGGYADAFQLLMNMCGYECSIVKGTAKNDTFSGDHAWNAVKIGKETRYVDVCWDDPLGQPPTYVRYLYYNITAEQIGKDHFPTK